MARTPRTAQEATNRRILLLLLPFSGVALNLSSAADNGKIPPWLATIGFALLVLVCLVVYLFATRESRRIRRAAHNLGFEYSAAVSPEISAGVTRFPFLGVTDRRVLHCIRGEWRGRPASVFITEVGARQERRTYLVSMLRTRDRLPAIEFVPRIYKTVGTGVGADIEMESIAFNRRWRVMCSDLKYGHAMAHPRMMERLLAAQADEVPVTFESTAVYTWGSSLRGKKRDLRRELDLLSDVVDLVPRHIVEDYRGRSSAATSPPGLMTVGRRDKNHIGRLAAWLPLSFVGAPVAIFVGHRALRACDRGEANNRRTAIAGIVFGWAMIAFIVTIGVLALMGY